MLNPKVLPLFPIISNKALEMWKPIFLMTALMNKIGRPSTFHLAPENVSFHCLQWESLSTELLMQWKCHKF